MTDSFDAIAKVLGCYRTATDPGRVEVVVAAVAGGRLPPGTVASAGFPHVRVVDGGEGDLRVAERRAVRVATAPYVVFAQAHAYPRPGYGDAIREARESGPWTVIGPSMANANPGSVLSRVGMWVSYGRWMDDPPRGVATDVPGHNSAYRREALLALGDEIDGLLEAGWQLQVALCARGGQCFLEPAACIEIVNPSRFAPFLGHFFHLGRQVAAKRGRRWSLVRRLAYAVGSPLIPFVRLVRIVVDGVRRRPVHAAWGGFPLLLLALTTSSAGEMVGYLFGPGPPSRFVRKA